MSAEHISTVIPEVMPPAPETSSPPLSDKPKGKSAMPVAAAQLVMPMDEKTLEKLQRDADRAAELHDLALVANKQDLSVEGAKEELKLARSELNATLKRIRELAMGNEQLNLKFNGKKASAAIKEGLATPDAAQAAFNAAKVSEILEGIPAAKIETLEADGIKTGKDLQAWVAAHPPRKISGIGEKLMEKITECMANWFERHPVAQVDAIIDALNEDKVETVVLIKTRAKKLVITAGPTKDGARCMYTIEAEVGKMRFVDAAIVNNPAIEVCIQTALDLTGSRLAEYLTDESLDVNTIKHAEEIGEAINSAKKKNLKRIAKSSQPHTAGQKSNGTEPGKATKGAAHKRTIRTLIEALDKRMKEVGLKPKVKAQAVQMRFGILSAIAGVPMDGKLINLEEAEKLTGAVLMMPDKQVREAAER